MKKLCLLFLLCAIAIGAIGCQKAEEKSYTVEEEQGVQVYKNRGTPAVAELVISPEKVFEYNGLDEALSGTDRELVWPRAMDTDSKGNFYILDAPSASVKKFSKDGTYIKSIGKKGRGPGETIDPYALVILNDILHVIEPYVQRVAKFDTEGNFIEFIKLKGWLPNAIRPVGTDKFIAFRFEPDSTDTAFSFNLLILNQAFEEIAVLHKYNGVFGGPTNDLPDRYTPFALSKDTIFVSSHSEKVYKINAFDFSGKLKYTIERSYDKVPYGKDESDGLNASLAALYKKAGIPEYKPYKNEYKKAIVAMHCDSRDRLWVRCSVPRDESNKFDFLVDVFKGGVFLKQVKLNFVKGYDYIISQERKLYFRDNRIFHINESTSVVEVFEY
ncbi:MAG: 6-bladed beta-propeller [bacterium]|nr:6-bladed beta-propeller [bacterium]